LDTNKQTDRQAKFIYRSGREGRKRRHNVVEKGKLEKGRALLKEERGGK